MFLFAARNVELGTVKQLLPDHYERWTTKQISYPSREAVSNTVQYRVCSNTGLHSVYLSRFKVLSVHIRLLINDNWLLFGHAIQVKQESSKFANFTLSTERCPISFSSSIYGVRTYSTSEEWTSVPQLNFLIQIHQQSTTFHMEHLFVVTQSHDIDKVSAFIQYQSLL